MLKPDQATARLRTGHRTNPLGLNRVRVTSKARSSLRAAKTKIAHQTGRLSRKQPRCKSQVSPNARACCTKLRASKVRVSSCDKGSVGQCCERREQPVRNRRVDAWGSVYRIAIEDRSSVVRGLDEVLLLERSRGQPPFPHEASINTKIKIRIHLQLSDGK